MQGQHIHTTKFLSLSFCPVFHLDNHMTFIAVVVLSDKKIVETKLLYWRERQSFLIDASACQEKEKKKSIYGRITRDIIKSGTCM